MYAEVLPVTISFISFTDLKKLKGPLWDPKQLISNILTKSPFTVTIQIMIMLMRHNAAHFRRSTDTTRTTSNTYPVFTLVSVVV
jgi:hypothetical protein